MRSKYNILKRKPVKAISGAAVGSMFTSVSKDLAGDDGYDTIADSREQELELAQVSTREEELDEVLKKRNQKTDGELAEEEAIETGFDDFATFDNFWAEGGDFATGAARSWADEMEKNNTDVDSFGNRTPMEAGSKRDFVNIANSMVSGSESGGGGWGSLAMAGINNIITGVGSWFDDNGASERAAYDKKYAHNVSLVSKKQDAMSSRRALDLNDKKSSETMARQGTKTMILKPKKAQRGSGYFSKYQSNNTTSKNKDYVDLGISAASGIANDYYTNQDVNYNSYGSVIPDRNTTIKNSTMSGALSGASAGQSLGSNLDVKNGGLYTTAGGIVLGGVTGYFGGKNKAKDEEEAYKEELEYNTLMDRKAFDVKASQWATTAKKGTKLGNFRLKKKIKAKALVMKTGGKLEVPGEVNVVVKGKLHKENNNLGNKDKGVPIIDNDGVKTYEVEAGEVIFRLDTTQLIERYAKEYSRTDDDNLLIELGKILTQELLNNTQDNYGKFDIETAKNEN